MVVELIEVKNTQRRYSITRKKNGRQHTKECCLYFDAEVHEWYLGRDVAFFLCELEELVKILRELNKVKQ